MKVTSLTLTDFRCFGQRTFTFDAPFVCIEGPNGSGKSSIVEALHYGCYFKSPRTSSVRDMIAFEREAFCVSIEGCSANEDLWNLTIGCSGNRRRIRLNNTPVTSFKDLYPSYRALSLSEDDLLIIKGSPEVRRSFLDTALLLHDPSYGILLKKYKSILDQRNALLSRGIRDQESFTIWSEQLFAITQSIQVERKKFLILLQETVHQVWQTDLAQTLSYKTPFGWEYSTRRYRMTEQFDEFCAYNGLLFKQEWIMGHSLFGAHTDDIIVNFEERASRAFASRGQQKLLLFLIKMAQFKLLGQPAIILIDDFLTDFDAQRIQSIVDMLVKVDAQVFLTTPSLSNTSKAFFLKHTYQTILLP